MDRDRDKERQTDGHTHTHTLFFSSVLWKMRERIPTVIYVDI